MCRRECPCWASRVLKVGDVVSALRVGVVGLGSMGRRHAEAYTRLAGVKLTAVATRHPAKRREAEEAWQVEATEDYRNLVGHVDAVTIAAPTVLHAEMAEFFAAAGVHVFVEKPIAATASEAKRLLKATEASGVCLMVGHIERFNPAFIRLAAEVARRGTDRPLTIRAQRMGPYDGRIQDVCVVLDLMIHDADLAGALAGHESWRVEQALGVPVVTHRLDLALADIELERRGAPPARVRLVASRVADAKRRVLEVSFDGFLGRADLIAQRVWLSEGRGELAEVKVDSGSALDLELAHFVASVHSGTRPAVTGEQATQALHLCLDVIQHIEKSASGS